MISNIDWNCLRFQKSGTHNKQINANMANMIALYLNLYPVCPMTIDHLTWMNWKVMFAMGRPCWRELFSVLRSAFLVLSSFCVRSSTASKPLRACGSEEEGSPSTPLVRPL